MRKKLLFLILLVLVIGAVFINRVKIKVWLEDLGKEPLPQAVSVNRSVNLNENQSAPSGEPAGNKNEEEKPLPATFNLKVPFIVQAPFGEWDKVHDEACEEASALIIHYFLQGQKSVSPEDADKDILAMVAWQEKNWGGHKDLEAAEEVKLIKDYLGYQKVELKYDITLDDIKKEVAAGYPVIVPAAGRMLGNKYYRSPGPLYHMLVVKGYTKDKIITNDPGTKRGADYVYSNKTFFEAIHEWNGGEVTKGRKAMIVVRD